MAAITQLSINLLGTTDVKEVEKTIRNGLLLTKNDPSMQQYFLGANDMLQLRKEDSKKINAIFWDISSFEHNKKELTKMIRQRRPDVIMLNKMRCKEDVVEEFACFHKYNAVINTGVNFKFGGVAILYDPKKIRVDKQNTGFVKNEDEGKSDIDWAWVMFRFAGHMYRLVCIYCVADAPRNEVQGALSALATDRVRCYFVGNFNRRNFKCNDMLNSIGSLPTYARLTVHEGAVVSSIYASRCAILSMPGDSLHVHVEKPKEPFYVNYAPITSFNFVVPFSIQNEED